ncbi:hypothetical protein [Actinoallomurus acaciae]|uniref:Uncharacterized protein n=1 Tax=Actinoallomurus acaciae TaxID=502577 RepID=A0ABV5YGQ6_9ACTN
MTVPSIRPQGEQGGGLDERAEVGGGVLEDPYLKVPVAVNRPALSYGMLSHLRRSALGESAVSRPVTGS